MLNIIWEYRFIIIIVLAVVLFALLEWQKFKAVSYGVMLQAKRQAKDLVLQSGQEQEEWVVKQLYQFLPKSLTVFISQKNMRIAVHYLYHKAKDYLDDGKLNGSI